MADLPGWSYYKVISITGQSGAGADYQIKLDIGDSAGGDFHLEGHCTNFPQDIRITDDDGTTHLDHWVEDLTADPIVVHVEVKDDLGSNQTIKVYYGKIGETTASDGSATFEFFDDFEDGDYTSNPVWTVQSGTWNAASNYLKKTARDGSWERITSPDSHDSGIWELKLKGLGTSLQNLQFYFMSKETNFQNGYFIYPQYSALHLYKVIGGSPSSLGTYSRTTDGNWHDYKLERDTSGNMKLYEDGTLRISATNTQVTGSTCVIFRTPRLESIDTIRLRKYNSPEPAFSSAGAEQTISVGWSDKIIGVSSPGKVNGIAAADISKIIGVA